MTRATAGSRLCISLASRLARAMSSYCLTAAADVKVLILAKAFDAGDEGIWRFCFAAVETSLKVSRASVASVSTYFFVSRESFKLTPGAHTIYEYAEPTMILWT